MTDRTISSNVGASLRASGYAVVRGVVPRHLCQAVADVIWDAIEADPTEPASWYVGTPRAGGMVNRFQHEAMWAVRQHPALYQAFSDALEEQRLWVTVDRLNMKPPARAEHAGHGDDSFVHVDLVLHDMGVSCQGVLALSDTAENGGTFQCVPGLWPERDRWLADIPAGTEVADVPLGGHTPVRIAVEVGDLIIWSSLLPHGNTVNASATPRLAMYVSMYPAPDDAVERAHRLADFTERRAPRHARDWPGVGAGEAGAPPVLSSLGRKLLGADLWPTGDSRLPAATQTGEGT